MKFQSRISGFPIYLPVEYQPAPVMNTYLALTAFPQLTQTRAANFTSARTWLQMQRKAPFTNEVFSRPKLAPVSYDRDSSMFNIELTNSRRVNGQFIFDASAELDGNWIKFDKDGLVLVQSPAKFIIITACGDSIGDGGNFVITDGAGNYAFITKDTSQYPLFGVSNESKKASVFEFSWTGFRSLKELIILFLKARYFLDHREVLNNPDKNEEIRQIYKDIGQIIIKQITGNRKENIYYRDYGFTPEKSEQFMDIKVELDDWRHPYPPFAVMPYVVKPFDSFIEDKPSTTSQMANDGVDYQRSVTYESSDRAFEEISFDNAIDAGIIANAKIVLAKAGIQTYAWDKIEQAVSPIGGSNDVWPAVLVINGNDIGVNFLHPVIAGSLLGTSPLFYFSQYDANVRQRSSTGIYVLNGPQISTSISDTPIPDPAEEHMCPCGQGEEKKEGFTCPSLSNMTPIQMLILLLIIVILGMVCGLDLALAEIINPSKNTSISPSV